MYLVWLGGIFCVVLGLLAVAEGIAWVRLVGGLEPATCLILIVCKIRFIGSKVASVCIRFILQQGSEGTTEGPRDRRVWDPAAWGA